MKGGPRPHSGARAGARAPLLPPRRDRRRGARASIRATRRGRESSERARRPADPHRDHAAHPPARREEHALPPSDPGAVPAPGGGAPSSPSAGSGQRPDAERGHVPRGGRGAPCRRGDPDLPRGREPARARADAASDGRRADGPGNGRRRGAAGDDALAHRPHVPRARDLPDRMGARARRRAGAGGGLPRHGGPRAGAGRARAHGPGGRGAARSHRRGRGSRDLASRRRPGGDSPRGGRGRPRSRRTIDVARGAGGVGPGRHACLSVARAPRARSGGALPGRGRELPRRSRADRPVAGRRGARVSAGDGPPLRAARGPGASRRPPARRLGPCEPRAPVLAHEGRRARGSGPQADVTATIKLVAGAILYPVCWALEAWGVFRLLGGWGLAPSSWA